MPAEATSPRIVSISGRPAATSEPNASSRITSVTGQESSSDFIIALRLASLKSDHMPEAPVRLTCTPSAPAAFSSPFRSSAAATISVVDPFAPALTIAVCPSCEIEKPARGSATDATRGIGAQDACDAVDRGGELRLAHLRRRGVDDDHQGGARLAAEVAVDQLARLHRLRAGCLPARARERCLDPRRQHAEPDGDDDPRDEHGAEVVGRPGAETADRADGRHRGHPFCTWKTRSRTREAGHQETET